jgi:hypothetical protein
VVAVSGENLDRNRMLLGNPKALPILRALTADAYLR